MTPRRGTFRALQIQVSADVEVREEQLGGVDHLVVPVIALVEGVLWPSNADEPALALAAEFGKYPASWDGRPVVWDPQAGHPEDDEGNKISANVVSLWDNNVVVGQMFNTVLDGKKLKSEMWINKDKAPDELLGRFEDPEEGAPLIEVSTGLWADDEVKSGKLNGKEYDRIWRNVVPDHLAILPEGMIGACSVADGCGAPRANSVKRYVMEANCSCQPGQGHKASRQNPATRANPPKGMKKYVASIMRALGLQSSDRSDSDTRAALMAALETEQGDSSTWNYIIAVYDDYFVYSSFGWDGDGKTYKRNYSIADGGTISMSSEKQEVRPETNFVPVVVEVNAGQSAAPAASSQETDMTQQTQQQGAGQPSAQSQGTPQTPQPGTSTPTPTPPTPGTTQPNVPTPAPAPGATPQTQSADPAAEALAYYNQRKQALITDLCGRPGSQFNANELQGMPVTFLEKTLAFVNNGGQAPAQQQPAAPQANAQQQPQAQGQQAVNYQGAAPQTQSAQAQGPSYTPPVPAFDTTPQTPGISANSHKGVSKRAA
jgi:hypothetical protein